MKLLPRILPDEEEEDRRIGQPEPAPVVEVGLRPLHWSWTAAVVAIAALPRLLCLFIFSDPENPGLGAYNDVWHHWQIAYLTREIGLSAPGGPRLWDLKGLDYFWGVLHPLLMVAVFDLTGSIDIAITDMQIIKTDTRVITMPPLDANYGQLRQANPNWFVLLGTMSNTNWVVYSVSVEHPTQQVCEEASRTASH